MNAIAYVGCILLGTVLGWFVRHVYLKRKMNRILNSLEAQIRALPDKSALHVHPIDMDVSENLLVDEELDRRFGHEMRNVRFWH